MSTIYPADLLKHLVKMEGDDYPTAEKDGEVYYSIPEGQVWEFGRYGRHKIKSIGTYHEHKTLDEWVLLIDCEHFSRLFEPDTEINLDWLRRYEVKFLPFTEGTLNRYLIEPFRDFSDDELWEWADQQEGPTINDISYDRDSNWIVIIPQFEEDGLKEDIGPRYTNDFHTYFHNKKKVAK